MVKKKQQKKNNNKKQKQKTKQKKKLNLQQNWTLINTDFVTLAVKLLTVHLRSLFS